MADNLLTEIQEDLNRERMISFFKQHGKVLAVIAVLAVIIVGGYEAWKYYDTEKRTKAGDELYQVVANFNEEKDAVRLKKVAEVDAYKEVATLVEANFRENRTNDVGAIKAYEKLAKDGSADRGLRELAQLNLVAIKLNADPADATAEAELKRLSNGVYKYTALEMLAAYYKKNGKNAESKETYKKIASDEAAPASLAGRAKSMISSF